MTDETTPNPTTPARRGRKSEIEEQLARGRRVMHAGIRYYKPRNSGECRYQVKVSARDAETGKWRAFWKTFDTRREAEAARDSLRTDRRNGHAVLPAKVTVREYLTLYIQGNQKIGETSRDRYTTWAAHISAVHGDLRLDRITPWHIEELSAALAKKFAPATRISVLTLFASACKQAVERDVLKKSPFKGVKLDRTRNKEAPKREKALSPDDVDDLLQGLAGSDYWLPVALLYHTGLRRGEMCALRWADVDPDAKTVEVKRGVHETKGSGVHVVDLVKTPNSLRTIAIDGDLAEYLRRHKVEQAKNGLKLGLAQSPDWLVFPDSILKPTQPHNPAGFASGLLWALRKTRFSWVTPHHLRYAHGSFLAHSGIVPRLAAKRMGHTVAQFVETYAKAYETDEADVVAKLATRWQGVTKGGKTGTGDVVEKQTNVRELKAIS